MAFDAAKEPRQKQSAKNNQQRHPKDRSSSSVSSHRSKLERKLDHDARISIGTAALVLLLLPLGYQLYSTTALTARAAPGRSQNTGEQRGRQYRPDNHSPRR